MTVAIYCPITKEEVVVQLLLVLSPSYGGSVFCVCVCVGGGVYGLYSANRPSRQGLEVEVVHVDEGLI